jgi:hypothetical protein
MTKTVQILNSSGVLIVEYPINLRILGANIMDNDFFDLAWETAIEDGLVDESSRSAYAFNIAR